MALTPYEPTTWVNDSEPDLDATNLNKVEQGIKDAIDGVNGILAALTNQLSTDPDKFAGIAVVNQLNTALNTLSNTVDTLNSNFVDPQFYSQNNVNVQFKAYKNKTGVVFLECYIIGEISAGGIIYTVPSDFRPSVVTSKSFWLPTTTSTWGTHVVTIGTDGNITTDIAIFRGNILFIYQK